MCNNYSQIPWCQPSSLSLQSFDPWSFKTIAIILLRCSLSELEPRETRSTDCTKPGKNSVNIYIHITTLAPKKKITPQKLTYIFVRNQGKDFLSYTERCIAGTTQFCQGTFSYPSLRSLRTMDIFFLRERKQKFNMASFVNKYCVS